MIFLLWLQLNGAPVVLGQQDATFLCYGLPQGIFKDYKNNGYRLQASPKGADLLLKVAVDNQLLKSKASARTCAPLIAELKPLEQALNSGRLHKLTDQIAFIVNWMQLYLKYEEGPYGQDVAAVCERGSGDCVGFANVFQHVLQALGVPSKAVTGVAFRSDDQALIHLKGNVLHRWVEIFYEDVGWVFTDPIGKVNFVDAKYLVIAETQDPNLPKILETLEGTKIELVAFKDGFWPALHRRDLKANIILRGN